MSSKKNLPKNFKIIDAHCDSILDVMKGKRTLDQASETAQADIPKLVKGGVGIQFFAIFIETEYKPDKALARALEGIDFFYRELEKNQKVMTLIDSRKKLNEIWKAKDKLGAILAIEGGEALGGQLSMVNIFYRLGVRSLGLTWNQRNEIADGVGVGKRHRGLTEFGQTVIKEMNRLGMLIDMAHLAEKGFWDVLEISKKPVAVTHANCQSLCNHPRNLTDKQLRGLAEKGGCLGITFVPQFIDKRNASLDRVLDHLEYALNKMGTDHVGLGSDYDGMEISVSGLEKADKFPRLVDGMSKRGISEETIEKVTGGNWLRLLNEVFKD